MITNLSNHGANDHTARRDLPPLRIHHLLAWMAVMAGMFAVLDLTKFFDPSESLWTVAVTIVGHIVCSAAVTCLAFGGAWWWRGLPFPSEPGHAFVIFTALSTLVHELVIVLFSVFIKGSNVPATAYYDTAHGAMRWAIGFMRWSGPIVGVLFAVLSIAFAIRLAQRWRWRLVFAVLATLFAMGAALQAFFF